MTYNQAAEIVLRKLASGDIPDDFPVKEEEVFRAQHGGTIAYQERFF